jgi:hypothetical protein
MAKSVELLEVSYKIAKRVSRAARGDKRGHKNMVLTRWGEPTNKMSLRAPKRLGSALTACVGMDLGMQTHEPLRPLMIISDVFVTPTPIKVTHSWSLRY